MNRLCTIKGRIGFRGYTRADLVKKGCGAISLSPSNIIDGVIEYDSCSYISWAKYDESPEIMVHNGDVIFCKTASVGKTAYVENLPEKATINPQFVLLKDIKCNAKYLSYLLATTSFQSAVRKITGQGTIPTFSQKEFGEIKVPIHNVQQQQHIVDVLDKLFSLTTSKDVGLPAEIQARQQQYEYYRDKLLTFKQISA